jgi:hypothetical protein
MSGISAVLFALPLEMQLKKIIMKNKNKQEKIEMSLFS